MGEVLKKFGRYFLLDHIAQGGMAEIYRARMATSDGGQRILAIKRIQAGYGSNSEFLEMFKSETRVTMAFNHPNIVQVYDCGDEQAQPYIAMELIDGKNLRQLMSRFNELKQPFPIELAAYIVEQAAAGLGYAHAFKDKISGQHLNIVHRDISPQNILIAYEGNIKVIDFGIAKAATNGEATRAGVIKGKPSYLSPEQISGEALDGRCDIFALGIVLWELLVGRKLFAGDNDLAVLKLIESCTTHVKPPSTLNPKVPKELDYIVLKALAKQREKRFQTGEEFQRALHKFLYGFIPDFNPSDLAYIVKDLFKEEIVEDRKRIQKLIEKTDLLLANDVPEAPKPSEGPVRSEKREDTTTVVEPRRAASTGSRELNLDKLKSTGVELEQAPPSKTASAPRPRPAPGTAGSMGGPAASTRNTNSNASRPSAPQQRMAGPVGGSGGNLVRNLIIGAAAVLAVSIFGPDYGVSVPVLSEMLTGGGSEARITLDGNFKGVTITVNGQNVGTSVPTTLKGLPVGTPLQLKVVGPNGTFQQEITLRKGEKKTLPVLLAASQQTPQEGTNRTPTSNGGGGPQLVTDGGKSIMLRLNITPGGGSPIVSINGKTVDVNNPVMTAPLDAPLELVAERQGFKPFKREFVLESRQMNGLKEWLMDVQLEPLRFGYLTIRATPNADATIVLDGKPVVMKTPIENQKFPIGTYNIKLSNDLLGMEKTVTVSVQDGKVVNVEERLELKN